MKSTVAFALALTVIFTGIAGSHAEAGGSKPDLIFSAVSAPSSASSGATIVVSGTVKNQGRASSNAFSVAAYLSTSPSSTTGAALLGTANVAGLAAGASLTLVGSLVIPGTTANGTFYIVAVADSTKVISESNESNNTSASGAIAVKNVTPPTISAVSSSGITASSATITWTTDKTSTSQAEYGTTAAYGSSTALSSSLLTSHTVTLSGLTTGAAYHFKVQSKDAAGNTAISNDYTFTTSIAGKTYYVATNGNDGDPGTEALPFRTLAHGVSVLTPGDTLYVMSGTYAEALLDNIPSGSSWSTPVTVAAYPGHTVTLKPNAGTEFVLHFQGPQMYIIIDGLILDATNVAYDVVKITGGVNASGPAHHIRLIRCEVKNAPGQGVLITDFADYNEFISLDVHDNGVSNFNHGFYISTSNNLVEGSTVHHNSGYGVLIYTAYPGQRADNNIVRNNRISGNGSAAAPYVAGINLSSGDGNAAYNNLVWGNQAGIQAQNLNPFNTAVYNNTVYANTRYGIYINSDSQDAVVRNNISYANGWADLTDYGVGSISDHNLVSTDPKFVNAAAGDFHLQLGSPAIDAGITLDAVTTDVASTPRPQGAAYDVGAFELVP